MPVNIKKFKEDIGKFQDTIGRRMSFLDDFATEKLQADLTDFSPVKTGNFKEKWDKVPFGEALQGVGPGFVFRSFKFNSIVFVNDTPYGLSTIPDGFKDPETGRDQSGEVGLNAGSSNQAPSGITEPVISKFTNEWPGMVAIAVRVIK